MDPLRTTLCKQRSTLSSEQVLSFSKKIQDVLRTYIQKDMVVGFYYAMRDEVQLQSLYDEVLPISTIGYPVCAKHGVMSFYQVNKDTTYKQSVFGIQEPISDTILLPQKFDIMIVPMVGFDEQCHRIGHGAGYYDRYLATTKALKIGVAFEIQKLDCIEVKPHDIDMDIIISESTIYKKDK